MLVQLNILVLSQLTMGQNVDGHEFIWRLNSRDMQPMTQWKLQFLGTLNLFTPKGFRQKTRTQSKILCIHCNSTRHHLSCSQYWRMSQWTSSLHKIRKADGERRTVQTGQSISVFAPVDKKLSFKFWRHTALCWKFPCTPGETRTTRKKIDKTKPNWNFCNETFLTKTNISLRTSHIFKKYDCRINDL